MSKAQFREVKEIVGKIPQPDFVRSIEYYMDEDHTGKPCVRIVVIVADGSDDAEVKKYLEYSNVVTRVILDEDIDLWPYVRFIGESDRKKMANVA